MKKTILLSLIAVFFASMISAQDEARLLRFPAIHGDQVVFTYAGDLYTVYKSGGIARKLTSHDGYEMFAKFSPDGSQIAFTGQYDGNTEVFLIPSEGGEPKRLTYTATLGRDDISDRMGPNNIVMTWKDDDEIVFRSRKKSFNSFKGQLFIAHTDGSLEEELPLPTGGFCSYAPNGKKMAYNRVFREFRTWKYYRGGMADDIWIYDFETKETVNITNNDAQDIFPMWSGETVYFLSDRDRTMNLFAYNINTGETKKVTEYTNFDIKFPSLGELGIIYENGGYLYFFDFSTQLATKLTIYINNDQLSGRDEIKDASKNIVSFALSPDGNRLVFGARGDVFTVPAKSGITRNLTQSSGVHDRNVEWSPDGKYISYISDRSGEDEIYIQKQDGSEPAIQLTNNSDTYKYNPIWAPDSKKLLWSDKMLRLQYVNIESKEVVQVDYSADGEMRDYTWSPDSRWIAYSYPDRNDMGRIFIYNLESKEKNPVTDIWYQSGNPSFSDNGKYLFFSSSRDFNPIYSWTEWNHAYRDMQKLYFITLQKDVKDPFAPKNDEVKIEEDKVEGEKEEASKEEASDDISIDFDGILNRIEVIPGEAGFYYSINAIGEQVYYCTGNSKMDKPKLKLYDLNKQKETDLGDYGTYIISADKKKMMIANMGKYAVIDLPKMKISIDDYAYLSNMKVNVNLKEEWKQIYSESWRQMRDFFYDPNMHGLIWENIHAKYEPLLNHVNNRNDLNYIIGEMIGEINIGHAYVNGGDKISPDRIKMGLLGAELSRDESGYYKIDKILKGENWTKNIHSPLTEIGIDINEGDFIIAINGQSTKMMVNIYEALIGTAGKQIELTVNSSAATDGAEKYLVKPIDDESGLYYYNWVHNNINKVNEATEGQVGYIHIPDMGPEGLNEFVKYFYPQLTKRGLIIDDRGNGGGNVSPMIIERLRRELALIGIARNQDPYTRPGEMHYGPKVMLIDNYSASDGDLFPYQFKKYEMGTIIGVRSWGGVVGIRGSLPFIDGGQLRKPEFAPIDIDQKKFVIEGHGVDPDIVVDNDPAKEYAGEDEQLNKAIEVVLEQIEEWPEDWMQVPDFPVKNK